jgi:predicted permease
MIKLGGIESTKEAYREQRGLPVLETLWQDIRYGARMLRKNPGFTAVAALTLAFGIGANTAIFTVVNALIFRSLPVRDPGELVQAYVEGPGGRTHTFTYPGYERLQDASPTLTGLLAAGNVATGQMVASEMGGTEIEMIRPQPVSGNFFMVLGVQAYIGRLLTPTDDLRGNPERVVVISHGFWQRRFGSDPSVIGKTITFFDVPTTIVGITSPSFFGIQPGENPDLWLPIHLMAVVRPEALGEGYDWLCLMGRVRPGREIRRAQSELAVAFQHYRTEHVAGMNAEDRRRLQQERLELRHAGNGWTRLRDQLRQPLMVMTVVTVMVLIIVCANVASLMLARAVARRREFSIRAALGAHRLRLVRQLITENVLLAVLGSVLGLVVAHWGTRLLVSFAGIQPDPLSFNLAPDTRVLGFTMALSLVTSLVFGLVPALRSSRTALTAAMSGSGTAVDANPARQFLQKSLVVAQVAVSLVLLVGAGLFVRTLQNLKGSDMGFSRENVVLFQTGFSQRVDKPRRVVAYKELLRRLEETPGVLAASMSRVIPLTENTWGQQLEIEGYMPGPQEVVRCSGMSVALRYFEVMGTSLLRGRDFGPQDEHQDLSTITNAPGVAIINETMGREYFGNGSALGHRFSFSGNAGRQFEIVGVVKDAKYRSLREPAPPTFYVYAFDEVRDWDMAFAVRCAQPAAVIGGLRNAIRETDSAVQMRGIVTMDDVVNRSLRRERIVASLGGFFSLTALALACLGVYGTISFMVAQRTREIGLRVALGAQPRDLLSLFVGSGLRLAVIGSVIGLAGALVVARLVSRLLYGVSPIDPATFVGVTLLLVVVATLASWLPARRAAKVHPMVALHTE